ncbi:MAG TPA: HNH endonuclease signature motif containing protein [Patescibacteria group bacterium]
MTKNLIFSSILFLVLSISFFIYSKNYSSQINVPISEITPVLGEMTKTADCVSSSGMPDSNCTPGAIFPNATKEQICKSGYSSSVRNVSTSTKKKVYIEYGVLSHTTGEYEVDHLISLELGGSNDISNLWPEAAKPTPGFHEKDLVENYLHEMVCSGKISLGKAQELIAHNWTEVYKSVSNIDSYNWSNRHDQ